MFNDKNKFLKVHSNLAKNGKDAPATMAYRKFQHADEEAADFKGDVGQVQYVKPTN